MSVSEIHAEKSEFALNSSRAAMGSVLMAPLAVCLIFGFVDGIRMAVAQSVIDFTAQQMSRWSRAHGWAAPTDLMTYADRDLKVSSHQSPVMDVSLYPSYRGTTIQVRSTFIFWAPKFVRLMIPGASHGQSAILCATSQA